MLCSEARFAVAYVVPQKRQDYEIDPKFKQAPLVKSKTTNPFKKTGTLKKVRFG